MQTPRSTRLSIRWQPWLRRLQSRLSKWQPPAESAEYLAWRHQFLLDRLQLALWIAFPVTAALAAHGIFMSWHSQQFEQDVLKFFEDATLIGRLRLRMLVELGVMTTVLLSCWQGLRSCWGRQHPAVIFLLLSSMLTWTDMIVSTCFGIPRSPNTELFLAQAVLIPIRWRLHLIAQLCPIVHSIPCWD
jgi:hypothetical protein